MAGVCVLLLPQGLGVLMTDQQIVWSVDVKKRKKKGKFTKAV